MIYEWKQNEDQLKFIWVEDKQSSSSNGIYDVGYLDRSYHGQLFKNDQLIAQSLTINEHECMIALDIIPNIHAFMNNVQEYIRSRKKTRSCKKSGTIHVGTFPIIKWLYRVMVVMGNRNMVV